MDESSKNKTFTGKVNKIGGGEFTVNLEENNSVKVQNPEGFIRSALADFEGKKVQVSVFVSVKEIE